MNSNREVLLPDEAARELIRKRSRRNFLVGGMAAVAGFAGYEFLTKSGDQDGVPWPQRSVLAFNRKLSQAYLSNRHLMPEYPASRIEPLKANGSYGLDAPLDVQTWSLKVTGVGQPLQLSLSDIQALPKVDMITRFCCIEGWSVITHWTGARFSDFTRKFFPPGRQLSPYVYMATPDEEYYVGLDMKSALHPQTLLAYEQNGQPLTKEHGAPLRLAIPVKYGIKNIKRIGSIQYTANKPGDYWAEEGYDWFAGL
jgi:DMSO/TMAO reductase YedYZ molybdopterin-dependent catalytic subunit